MCYCMSEFHRIISDLSREISKIWLTSEESTDWVQETQNTLNIDTGQNHNYKSNVITQISQTFTKEVNGKCKRYAV